MCAVFGGIRTPGITENKVSGAFAPSEGTTIARRSADHAFDIGPIKRVECGGPLYNPAVGQLNLYVMAPTEFRFISKSQCGDIGLLTKLEPVNIGTEHGRAWYTVANNADGCQPIHRFTQIETQCRNLARSTAKQYMLAGFEIAEHFGIRFASIALDIFGLLQERDIGKLGYTDMPDVIDAIPGGAVNAPAVRKYPFRKKGEDTAGRTLRELARVIALQRSCPACSRSPVPRRLGFPPDRYAGKDRRRCISLRPPRGIRNHRARYA